MLLEIIPRGVLGKIYSGLDHEIQKLMSQEINFGVAKNFVGFYVLQR